MGASANAGITNLNPATDFLRDGADAIDRLGDELIDKLIGASLQAVGAAATAIPHNTDTLIKIDTSIRDDFQTYLTPGLPWFVASPSWCFYTRQAGRYMIWGSVGFTGAAIGTRRSVSIRKNGTVPEGGAAVYGSSTQPLVLPSPMVELDLAIADAIQLYAFQDSGVSVNTVVGSPNRPVLNVKRVK